jgi:hemerythrin
MSPAPEPVVNAVRWQDSYAIGVAEIDRQHRRLFDLTNEVIAAAARGQREVTVQVFQVLVDYIREHFAMEERLMAEIQYAGADNHRSEHFQFTKAIFSAHNDFLEGRAVPAARLVPLMNEWLLKHILDADRAYVPALRAAGRITV